MCNEIAKWKKKNDCISAAIVSVYGNIQATCCRVVGGMNWIGNYL